MKIEIKYVEIGLKTMTGGRIKELKIFYLRIKILLVYGDGLSDVNIKKLIKFHEKIIK